MRTHTDIVAAADPKKIAEARGIPFQTVRFWGLRGSIPAEHWQWFVDNDHASYEELAKAAPARKAAA